MIKKITEDEIRKRFMAHLKARPGNRDVVGAVWHGYIVGLVEWGAIDLASYRNLTEALPHFGKDEVSEIMQGFDGDDE